MERVEINKDLLYKYYIKENKTREETARIFNITSNQAKYLIKKYGIIKDRNLFSKNISKSQLNKTLSIKIKNKISKSKKGSIAWNKGLTKETDSRVAQYANKNKGKTRTKEQKELISIRTKDGMNNDRVKQAISNANKKRIYTKEQRLKKSIISRKLWSNPDYARKCTNPKFGNKPIYNNIKYMSDTEMLFAKKLDELNIFYNYQCGPFKYLSSKDNKYHNYYPDFYLPKYDLYLEVKYSKNHLHDNIIRVNDKLNGMKALRLNCILLDRRDLINLEKYIK